MLSKILSTATLIVASWLSMQLMHTHKALDSTKVIMHGELENLRNELANVSEKNEDISNKLNEQLVGLSSQVGTLSTDHNVDVLGRVDGLSGQIHELKTIQQNVIQANETQSHNHSVPAVQQNNQEHGDWNHSGDQNGGHQIDVSILWQVHDTLLESDRLAQSNNAAQGAAILLSTKDVIWQASDILAQYQGVLRELMAPIDILAGLWQSGDVQGNTEKIRHILLGVLEPANHSLPTDIARFFNEGFGDNQVTQVDQVQQAVLAAQSDIVNLVSVHEALLEAEQFAKNNDGASAAAKVLWTKDSIWAASEQYPQYEQVLQSLMEPVDVLAGRWQSGDLQADTYKLRTILLAVIAPDTHSMPENLATYFDFGGTELSTQRVADPVHDLNSLQEVHDALWQADQLAKNGNGEQAAELLLSTKQPIWIASDAQPQNQVVLQELMQPIDILSQRWKGGDFEGDSHNIREVLLRIISPNHGGQAPELGAAGIQPSYARESLNIFTIEGLIQSLRQADAVAANQDGARAVEILRFTKDGIWNESINTEQHKEALQNLMWPIDVVLERWERGVYDDGTNKIQQALTDVLVSIKPNGQ